MHSRYAYAVVRAMRKLPRMRPGFHTVQVAREERSSLSPHHSSPNKGLSVAASAAAETWTFAAQDVDSAANASGRESEPVMCVRIDMEDTYKHYAAGEELNSALLSIGVHAANSDLASIAEQVQWGENAYWSEHAALRSELTEAEKATTFYERANNLRKMGLLKPGAKIVSSQEYAAALNRVSAIQAEKDAVVNARLQITRTMMTSPRQAMEIMQCVWSGCNWREGGVDRRAAGCARDLTREFLGVENIVFEHEMPRDDVKYSEGAYALGMTLERHMLALSVGCDGGMQ